MISIEVQLLTVFFLAWAGMLAGIIIDLHNTVMGIFKFRPWKVIIIDFFLWIWLTFLAAYLLLHINQGEVRAYIFICLGLGLIIYYMWFSIQVKKIFRKILTVVRTILIGLAGKLSMVKKIVSVPGGRLIRAAFFPLNKTKKFIKSITKKNFRQKSLSVCRKFSKLKNKSRNF